MATCDSRWGQLCFWSWIRGEVPTASEPSCIYIENNSG
jgi:hypothetical protein